MPLANLASRRFVGDEYKRGTRWFHALGLEFDDITDAFLQSYVAQKAADGAPTHIKVFDEALYRRLVDVVAAEQKKKINYKMLRYRRAKSLDVRA